MRWSPDLQVDPADQINKVARIQQLIHSYRVRGHLMADTDPLEYVQRKHPDLDVLTYGLTLWDLDREWPTGGFGGKPMLAFRDILGVLRDAYCRTTGIEYMHIQEPAERKWFQDQLEHPYSKPSREEQLRIVSKLNAAEAFETFLQTKFVGQKRFSLEGGESLIPLLDAIISDAADDGLDEVAIGMAHRGRLNVLTNIAGKTYAQVFREFEGTQDPRSVQGSGDVKYHLGTEGTFTSDNGKETKVYLAANPSHLEAVDSVLEGIVRAKQDRLDQGEAFPVLPIMVHGDAAFAGQGVVAETLNLSQLRGYRTGGTIHVVVNNQVGFTTAPSSSRSSTYSTDVAKMIQAPVFHVNGDDPGGSGPHRPARLRVPPAVPQGRCHRHGLLPPPWPQRGRRPLDDPAADVQPHRGQALRPQAVHRVADRPRRHHRGRSRAAAPRLPGAPRACLRRDPCGADLADPDHHRGLRSRLGHRAAQRPAVGLRHQRPGVHRDFGGHPGPHRQGAPRNSGGLHGPRQAQAAPGEA